MYSCRVYKLHRKDPNSKDRGAVADHDQIGPAVSIKKIAHQKNTGVQSTAHSQRDLPMM